MTEHPIIFDSESIRAYQDGRKTQTRRVFKGRDYDWWQSCGAELDDKRMPVAADDLGDWHVITSPYGVPGDRLRIKERYCIVEGTHGLSVAYRADLVTLLCETDDNGKPVGLVTPHVRTDEAIDVDEAEGTVPWRSPMFMPAWASRYRPLIVSVRVERLQDISEADAIAEGIEVDECHHVVRLDDVNWGGAVWEYASIWNRLNKKRGYPWESNPFCWAITFEREK